MAQILIATKWWYHECQRCGIKGMMYLQEPFIKMMCHADGIDMEKRSYDQLAVVIAKRAVNNWPNSRFRDCGLTFVAGPRGLVQI